MAERVPAEVLDMMAVRFRLIGEPTRLAIIHALLEGGERSVGQLADETGRGDVNVSRHLKQLARAKLVSRRKSGLQVFYRLTDPVVEKVCRLACVAILEDYRRQAGTPAAGE